MSEYRRILALFVAATGVMGGCTWNPDADAIGADDREIMRALVAISCQVGVDNIVVSDRPAVPRDGDRHDAGQPNVQFGIDLDRRHAHAAHWAHQQVCSTVKVVPAAALETALAQENKTEPSWEHFSAKFGGARTLMRISLPVYSPDGTRAVVYTESTCPYTCGTGFYHELRKQSGRWQILESKTAWIS